MNLDNVYSFTVQRQNSSEVAPGKSPCVKIKFIKDESIKNSPKYKIGVETSLESSSVIEDEKPDVIIDDISADSSPLSICPIFNRDSNEAGNLKPVLIELHKMIEKKDTHIIFAYPVTEEQAPNYSNMIDHPMDLQKINHNIYSGVYRSVVDLIDDVVLMCHNALIYNTSDTVYYKIAAQMLNYAKKIFAKEAVNKLVASRLNWSRCLTDEEMGDWSICLSRINDIQNEVIKNIPSSRPHRAPQRKIQQDISNKRKYQEDLKLVVSKKPYIQTNAENLSNGSDFDDGCSKSIVSELSGDDGDNEDDETANEILTSVKKAAMVARQRLEQSKSRSVVYLDQVDDNIVLVNTKDGQTCALEDDFQEMVMRLGSVNVEQMIGENDRILAQLGQLCYDPNEAVSLTTSKPLEPYSCAEQAVLVETFGDVVTAEFACNMHNFVLDLPQNSPALNVVKNKLNTATNYLTYGVDQIIIKKLKATAEASVA